MKITNLGKIFFFLILLLPLLLSCGEKKSEIPPSSVSMRTLTEQTQEEAMTEVSVSHCFSQEELKTFFSQRKERGATLYFETRGSDVGSSMAVKGNICYILGEYDVKICSLSPLGAVMLSSLSVGYPWEEQSAEDHWGGREKQCVELLVSDSFLIVLSDQFEYSISAHTSRWNTKDTSRCTVDIFDISDPAVPLWIRSFSQSGRESSCLVSGGKLFLLTDREIFRDDTLGEGTLPGWWEGDQWSPLGLEDVCLCDRGDSSYLLFGVYDPKGEEEPSAKALVGCGKAALLCDGGLYGIIPEQNGGAVYFLSVKEGSVKEPYCTYLAQSVEDASSLTPAGAMLCILQDGSLIKEEVDWHSHFGESGHVALQIQDNAVNLLMLSVDGNRQAEWTLGRDFAAAAEEEYAIFLDSRCGLIGLPSEDGYTLMSWDGESFSHVLDCYSSDSSHNRRFFVLEDTLFIGDKRHLFTVDLREQELIGRINF